MILAENHLSRTRHTDFDCSRRSPPYICIHTRVPSGLDYKVQSDDLSLCTFSFFMSQEGKEITFQWFDEVVLLHRKPQCYADQHLLKVPKTLSLGDFFLCARKMHCRDDGTTVGTREALRSRASTTATEIVCN